MAKAVGKEAAGDYGEKGLPLAGGRRRRMHSVRARRLVFSVNRENFLFTSSNEDLSFRSSINKNNMLLESMAIRNIEQRVLNIMPDLSRFTRTNLKKHMARRKGIH